MINKQLLGIIGAMICSIGIFLPAYIDGHCRKFFEYDWEKPFYWRFTCGDNNEANIFFWWGYWSRAEYNANQRLATVLLVVAILVAIAVLIKKLYPILWGMISVIIACTVYLYQVAGDSKTPLTAYAALVVGCVLLIVSASTKEAKS